MLLHALSTKIGRHLRIIVTWTDIRVSQATIALHGLMRARARQTQWFPPRAILLLKIRAETGTLSGYLKHPPPTIDPVR